MNPAVLSPKKVELFDLIKFRVAAIKGPRGTNTESTLCPLKKSANWALKKEQQRQANPATEGISRPLATGALNSDPTIACDRQWCAAGIVGGFTRLPAMANGKGAEEIEEIDKNEERRDEKYEVEKKKGSWGERLGEKNNAGQTTLCFGRAVLGVSMKMTSKKYG